MKIRHRLSRTTGLSVLLSVCLCGCANGCSTSSGAPDLDAGSGHPPSDAGSKADAHKDTGIADTSTKADSADTSPSDSSTYDASTDVVEDVPLPDGVPDGWEPYSEFSPACRFYVPGKNGQLPPSLKSLQWEDCPFTFPSGVSCSKIKQTWLDHPEGAIDNFAHVFFELDPQTNKPLLAFVRYGWHNNPSLGDAIVAEADGQVRFSLLQASKLNSGCGMLMQTPSDAMVSIHLYGDDPSNPSYYHEADGSLGSPEGIVADSIDSRHPRLALMRKTDAANPGGRVSAASSGWLVELTQSSLYLHDWNNLDQSITGYSPDQGDGLPPLGLYPRGKDLQFMISAGGNVYTMSYTPAFGLRPMLFWSGDRTRGAGNFGTDGKDMVWTYGQGKPLGGWYNDYKTMTMMTAPYTTDPQVAQSTAKKVREEFKTDANIGHDSQGWRVGCGYAARTTGRRGIIVTRLSDAVSWAIPMINPDATAGQIAVGWTKALGVTCNHVYVLADSTYVEGGMIMRFPLNALGSPIPPAAVDIDVNSKPIY